MIGDRPEMTWLGRIDTTMVGVFAGTEGQVHRL